MKPNAEYLNLKYFLLPCLKSLLPITRLRQAFIQIIYNGVIYMRSSVLVPRIIKHCQQLKM